MADISLRTYLEEIDGMIDGNRVEEAVAHLKHILGIYPKNLDAYRLLAKALLEKNRHLDAADVFQRVLSSVPDDFISHIGMAVVREDEGNLDAAIWHMERAYEVQPNNGPIQEELRRLYGKRDGVEPPRVRLTRGALARMYERGDLYPQAIAELRAALADDPERLDLKVLLASALWRSKQRVEAAETSAKILEVLPYCKEANRILAHVWEESGRKKESQGYRRRLEALDPYEAYADPAHNGNGALNVPPENVRLPRFESATAEQPAAEAARPDWMEALGIQYDQAPADETAATAPDWLDTLTASPGAGAASTADSGDWLATLRGEETPAAAPATEAADWLTAAPETATAASGDWLAGLTSAAAGPSQPAAPAGDDWFNEVLGAQGPAGAPSPVQPPPAEAEADQIPGWLSEPAAELQPAQPAQPAGGMTTWLTAMGEAPAKAAAPAAAEEVSDWLKTAGTDSTATESVGEIPDWLKGSAETAPSAAASANEVSAEVPDWLKGSEESPFAPPAAGEALDWLTGAATEPAPTAAAEPPDWLKASDGSPAAAVPDWLGASPRQVQSGASPRQVQSMASPAASQSAAPESSDLPDWLKAAEEPGATAVPSAAVEDIPPWLQQNAPAAVEPVPELPDWLSAGEPADAKAAEMARAAEEIPDWMAAAGWAPRDPSIPLDSAANLSDLESGAEASPPLGEVPDWLKTMKPPEEPRSALKATGEAPDWLRQALEGGAAETPSAQPAESQLAPSQPPAQKAKTGILSRLKDQEPPAAAAQPQPETDISDWLATNMPAADAGDSVATFLKEKSTPAPAGPSAASVESMSPDEALAWLESLAAGQGAKEEELVTKRDVPDWLRKPTSEETPAEPPSPTPEGKEVEPIPEAGLPDWLRPPAEAEMKATPPTPDWLRPPVEAEEKSAAAMSEGEALAWLESLAAKQGANPEELVTRPEERPALEPAAELPEWLRTPSPILPAQVSEAEGIVLSREVESPLEEAALPDWLRPAAEIPLDADATVPMTEFPAMAPQPAAPADTMSEDAALAWLESLAAKQGASAEELVSKPEARAEALPAWIQAEIVAPVAEPAPVAIEEKLEIEEKPDWLKQMEAEADQYEAVAKGEPPMAEPPTVAALSSEDEALAWLESLAAKQGASAEELVSKPGARAEALPAWIQAEMAAPAAPIAEPTPEPVVLEEKSEEKPEWLKQMEAEADQYETVAKGEPPTLVEPASAAELPAWLTAEPEPLPAEPAAWAPPPVLLEPTPELPAWLAAQPEPSLAEPVAAMPPAIQPEPTPELELPAWLAAQPEPSLAEPAAWMPPTIQPEPEPTPEPEPAWAPMAAVSEKSPAAVEPPPPPKPAAKAVADKLKRAKKAKPSRKQLSPAAQLRRSEPPEIVLALARERLLENNIPAALEIYNELLTVKQLLPDIIADLDAAALKNPSHPELLRALGDAYMQAGQLQLALDTYKQALEQL